MVHENIDGLIKEEEKRLLQSSNPSEGLNILYNLVLLKRKSNQNEGHYTDFKKIIDYYIEVVKLSDYGYDKLNHKKIDVLLSLLTNEEQVAALNYAISISARELPEYKRDWLVNKRHDAEIKYIFSTKQYCTYLKGLMLFFGRSLSRLLLLIIFFLVLVVIVLLPARNSNNVLFQITYDKYSDNFYLNHGLNILAHFANIDNNFKIAPINFFGVILLITGKLVFILIVVNFVYRKITDKLDIK